MAEVRGSRFSRVVAALLAAGLVVCLGLIAFGRSRLEALARDNAHWRDAANGVEELRRENQRLQRLEVDHDEFERYRKQAEEVHKLRAQYQDWQRLQTNLALLQQENERLRSTLAGVSAAAPPPSTPANRGVWIGIGLRPVTDPATGGQGTAVASVIPGGPAANSGLRPGDVILAVNGQAVTTVQQIKEAIRTKSAGAAVLVDVMREGTRLQFSAAAEPLPTFD